MLCLQMSQLTKRSRTIFGILLLIAGIFLIIVSWFPLASFKFISTHVNNLTASYYIAVTNIQNTLRHDDVRGFTVSTTAPSSGSESYFPDLNTLKTISTPTKRSTLTARRQITRDQVTVIPKSTKVSSLVARRPIKRDQFTVIPNCTTRDTGVEDILCLQRPDFLHHFRNPCWYQNNKLRCLPYFQIIGVCKSGTSDLFKRITMHPQVLKNSGILNKELWYWTWLRYGETNFHKRTTQMMTLDNFIDSFNADGIARIKKDDDNSTDGVVYPAVTGHGDPMDFWDQQEWKKIPQNDPDSLLPKVTTPALIKHVNPEVKLILMLRDPVERLFSHYLHGHFGQSAAQFHDDVISSLEILQSCNKTLSLKACLYSKDTMKKMKVPLYASFYSVHLFEWLRVFTRKQILILRTEEFSKNMVTSLMKIFRFLRIDPLPAREVFRIASMPHFYYTKSKKFAGTIRPDTVQILQDVFRPYNHELAAMLNDTGYLWES